MALYFDIGAVGLKVNNTEVITSARVVNPVSINVGGVEIVTSARVLQNLTIGASQLTGTASLTSVNLTTTLTVTHAVSGSTATLLSLVNSGGSSVLTTTDAGVTTASAMAVGSSGYLQVEGVTRLGATSSYTAVAGETVVGFDKTVWMANSAGSAVLSGLKMTTGNTLEVGSTSAGLRMRFVDAVSLAATSGSLSAGAADSGGTGYRVLRIPN